MLHSRNPSAETATNARNPSAETADKRKQKYVERGESKRAKRDTFVSTRCCGRYIAEVSPNRPLTGWRNQWQQYFVYEKKFNMRRLTQLFFV